MQSDPKDIQIYVRGGDALRPRRVRHRWRRLLAGAAAALMLAGVTAGQEPMAPNQRPHMMSDPSQIAIADDGLIPHEEPMKQKTVNALNEARRKELAADSAKILALAEELKADMDKTSKDMLSLSVIRKADEIEKLAHNVKEKMK